MMKKNITIIGVPMDLGQSHRGVDMGPNAIRYAGVVQRLEQLNYRIQDLGNISVRQSNQENIDTCVTLFKLLLLSMFSCVTLFKLLLLSMFTFINPIKKTLIKVII